MRHRFLRKRDLSACAALLGPSFGASTEVQQRLPAIWGGLLTNEQMIGLVVEEPGATGARRLAAFGMSVFVSDAFLDGYLAAPRPHLAARIYQQIVGGNSPVLGIDAIRAANSASGLNLVILHYFQQDWDLTTPKALELLYASSASVRLAHEGYKIKRVLDEAYGPQHREILLAGGLLLKSDFGGAGSVASGGATGAVPTWLFGLDREDLENPLPGRTITYFFREPNVRFGFSHAEQRVLLRAVIEESTDHEIADDLGISLDAVKQVWRRVYQRVAAVEPSVLGDESEEPELTRGSEKRRRLIAHLRVNLEELRPQLRQRPV